jgi:hypothetical protein|tara:strand:+ start:2290 stop:2526 length:237 start_codon:yes stop_codon:yes gene_type:complete
MAVLTMIGGVPLYSTVAEALAYAAANGLSGYHTHVYQGQVGYMGGATHGAAATPSSGFSNNNNTSGGTTSSSGGGGGY